MFASRPQRPEPGSLIHVTRDYKEDIIGGSGDQCTWSRESKAATRQPEGKEIVLSSYRWWEVVQDSSHSQTWFRGVHNLSRPQEDAREVGGKETIIGPTLTMMSSLMRSMSSSVAAYPSPPWLKSRSSKERSAWHSALSQEEGWSGPK
jgi:hypothetical protein